MRPVDRWGLVLTGRAIAQEPGRRVSEIKKVNQVRAQEEQARLFISAAGADDEQSSERH